MGNEFTSPLLLRHTNTPTFTQKHGINRLIYSNTNTFGHSRHTDIYTKAEIPHECNLEISRKCE